MARALTKGDPVTMVVGPSTHHATYNAHGLVDLGRGWLMIWEDEEGVRWIRGHYDPESDEVKALLAAWMLVKSG